MENKENQKINSVEVIISGEIVTLSGSESEEYFLKVARYLDRKIATIQQEKKMFSFNSSLKTLMIAANITDDYFKALDKNVEIEQELEKTRTELAKLEAENLLLNEKIKELQMNNAHTYKPRK